MVSRTRGLMALALVALAGCSAVLGGLDEGTGRTAAPAIAAADAGRPRPCGPWLDGWRHRRPFVVVAKEAASGYQVAIDLDTAASIAAGSMRADAADVRVTADDGETVVPHWIERDVGTSATKLWARLDLAVGPTRFWVYYGKPDAIDAGSLAATFVSGIVDAPAFDRSEAWTAASTGFDGVPSRTNEWSVEIAKGAATVRLVRQANENGAYAALCQTMLFPAGSSYRFDVDVYVTISDNGGARVWFDGVGVSGEWTSRPALGALVGHVEPIDPGVRTICFGDAVENSQDGQGVEATFSRLRVRRVLPDDPKATAAGPEEAWCE